MEEIETEEYSLARTAWKESVYDALITIYCANRRSLEMCRSVRAYMYIEIEVGRGIHHGE
jgi:hypothetical protein